MQIDGPKVMDPAEAQMSLRGSTSIPSSSVAPWVEEVGRPSTTAMSLTEMRRSKEVASWEGRTDGGRGVDGFRA